MTDAPRPLAVAILAVPESTASTLYGMYEILESAGRDWPLLMDGVPGPSALRPVIVSADGRGFRARNALWIEPGCAIADAPVPDVIAIPDLMVTPGEDLSGRYPLESRWLADCYSAGTTLATACTGALVLAQAGLLDGQDATTHWAYSEAMAAQYPGVRLHAERALVISGEGRLVMAGGGTSWHDLALFLIARFAGTDEAMRVARLHLLDWHRAGQQPFASLTRNRQRTDALIGRCQDWLAEHFAEDSPVAAMGRLSGLPERSLTRRFSRATGMSPLEYVHVMRLEEAKHALETTALSVDDVASQIGYGDPSFFNRLFRRKVGLTPAQYRRRFRTLRQALDGSTPS